MLKIKKKKLNNNAIRQKKLTLKVCLVLKNLRLNITSTNLFLFIISSTHRAGFQDLTGCGITLEVLVYVYILKLN